MPETPPRYKTWGKAAPCVLPTLTTESMFRIT